MNGVVISPNIKKESVRINTNGDVIDPRTKQIVSKNEPDYVPSREEIEAQINAAPAAEQPPVPSTVRALSIKEQIIEAEKHLADLKVLRVAEIEKMKAELAELEADV